MVRQGGGRRFGQRHALFRAGRVTAPRRVLLALPAPALGVRVFGVTLRKPSADLRRSTKPKPKYGGQARLQSRSSRAPRCPLPHQAARRARPLRGQPKKHQAARICARPDSASGSIPIPHPSADPDPLSGPIMNQGCRPARACRAITAGTDSSDPRRHRRAAVPVRAGESEPGPWVAPAASPAR